MARGALPAIILALSPVARADGDRALSADAGLATFSALGKPVGKKAPPSITPDLGFTLGGIYEHGVSTDVSLRGELAGCLFEGGAAKGQSEWSGAGLADVGVVFRFDVLKYVPYAFGAVGGLYSSGGPLDRGVEPVLAIGGGLDVLTSRSRSWGGEIRIASFGGDVTVVSIAARGTIRWGYF